MGKFAFGKDDFNTDNLVKKHVPKALESAPVKAPEKAQDADLKKSAPKAAKAATKVLPDGDTYEEQLRQAKKKAGFKTPMMAMHFSTANYDYIREEAAARGTSATMVVNKIIELYRSDPSHVHKRSVIEEW